MASVAVDPGDAAVFGDFKDTVYPFLEAAALFLECLSYCF